jgi:hypothetical protein
VGVFLARARAAGVGSVGVGSGVHSAGGPISSSLLLAGDPFLNNGK